MDLYALVYTVIVFAVLVIVWSYLGPNVGEPWYRIGWVIIGAIAVLWLLRLLLVAGPVIAP